MLWKIIKDYQKMKTGKYQIARSRVKKSDRQRRFNMFNWIILKKKKTKN